MGLLFDILEMFTNIIIHIRIMGFEEFLEKVKY